MSMNKSKAFLRRSLKIVFLSLLFNCTRVFAQEIDMQQTLNYINGKFAGKCSLDVSKGVIIAVYQQGGQNVREDQVDVSDLNMSAMKYDKEYTIFSIDCKGAPGKKCVSRELFVAKKTGRYYARISWDVTLDDKGVNGMKKAFTHLIKLVLEPKYKSSEAFE